MLNRLRHHLSPPMVISTIALFAALGGGYAVAFSGSGSLQKAGSDNCPTSFGNYRTLTGFGVLQLRFNTAVDPDALEVRFVNSTGKSLSIEWFDWTKATSAHDTVGPNMTQATPFVLNDNIKRFNRAEFHISKYSATSGNALKAQVQGGIRAEVASNACEDVRVLALNTEQ